METCENCDKPATEQDDEGVPLCKECYDAIVEESAPSAEEHPQVAGGEYICRHGVNQISGLGVCTECTEGVVCSMNSQLASAAAELAQLRAANAEWKRRHRLLAAEVKAYRELDAAEMENMERFLNGAVTYRGSSPTRLQDAQSKFKAARAATDAGGAMEVGG